MRQRIHCWTSWPWSTLIIKLWASMKLWPLYHVPSTISVANEKWLVLFCFPTRRLHLLSLFQTYQTYFYSWSFGWILNNILVEMTRVNQGRSTFWCCPAYVWVLEWNWRNSLGYRSPTDDLIWLALVAFTIIIVIVFLDYTKIMEKYEKSFPFTETYHPVTHFSHWSVVLLNH